MTTNARTNTDQPSHYYLKDGTPFYEVPYADPKKGMRRSTLADARKVGALPSVTTIMRVLDKPALNDWKVEQGVLAVMTTPQKPGETTDQFIHRVLHVDRIQDEEARKARDTGTQIHEALDNAISGKDWDKSLSAFVEPILKWRMDTGNVVWTEKILVGDGYAGRADLMLDSELLNCLVLTDFKTTSKLPDKDSWPEHKLQTAAYAQTIGNTGDNRIVTCNVYISTKTPGDFVVFAQTDWQETYACGFKPILDFWQWSNKYHPTPP